MATQQTSNGAGEKRLEFSPTQFDANNIVPDAAVGTYTGEVDDIVVRVKEDGDNRWPQLRIDWKLVAAQTEDDGCEASIGNVLSDYITFRPDGDKKGNWHKRRLKQMGEALGMDLGELIPGTIESAEDFEQFIANVKGQQGTVFVVHEEDRETKEMRARLNYTAPRSSLGPMAEEVEEAPAKKPAKKAAGKPAPAKKTASRR